MSQTKTERLHLRVTPEQSSTIKRAAELLGTSVTDFALGAALASAHEKLADQRLFLLDDAAWAELNAVLERPVMRKRRLRELFAEDSIFE